MGIQTTNRLKKTRLTPRGDRDVLAPGNHLNLMNGIIELLIPRTIALETLVIEDSGDARSPERQHDGIVVNHGEDGFPFGLLLGLLFLAEDVFDLGEEGFLRVGRFEVGKGLEVAERAGIMGLFKETY